MKGYVLDNEISLLVSTVSFQIFPSSSSDNGISSTFLHCAFSNANSCGQDCFDLPLWTKFGCGCLHCAFSNVFILLFRQCRRRAIRRLCFHLPLWTMGLGCGKNNAFIPFKPDDSLIYTNYFCKFYANIISNLVY